MPAQMKRSTPPSPPLVDPLDTPLLLAVPDAARLLGIGTTFAWELVRTGALPSVKLGRRVLVPRAALERLADVHTIEGGQGHGDSAGMQRPHALTRRHPHNDAPSTGANGDRQI